MNQITVFLSPRPAVILRGAVTPRATTMPFQAVMSQPITEIDRFAARPMFVAALLFLALLAGSIHLHDPLQASPAWRACIWGMAALYPLFVAELVIIVWVRNRFWNQNLLFCLLPPLRIGAKDHATGQRIWLPRSGWTRANPETAHHLEQKLSVPMLLIALLVIPLMATEHYGEEWLSESVGRSLSAKAHNI